MKTLHVYPKSFKTRDTAANKALLVKELKPLLDSCKLPVPANLGESLDAAVIRVNKEFPTNAKELIAKLADSSNTTLDYSIVCSHA